MPRRPLFGSILEGVLVVSHSNSVRPDLTGSLVVLLSVSGVQRVVSPIPLLTRVSECATETSTGVTKSPEDRVLLLGRSGPVHDRAEPKED